MLINLLEEYPVIAIEEAHMLGQVNGAVLQENLLVALSCSMKNEAGVHHFQVPLNRIILGTNAVMVQNTSVAHILTTNGQVIKKNMSVFTPMGELVGKVTAIHISRDRVIKGIHTECGYIKNEEIKKIGDIIIVGSIVEKGNFEPDINNDEDPTDELIYNESDHSPMEEPAAETESIEIDEEAVEEIIELTEPAVIEQVEPNDAIYSKYKYLIGKKLLNPVTIDGQTYTENTMINTKLIESSLKYNCILNLIMNAED